MHKHTLVASIILAATGVVGFLLYSYLTVVNPTLPFSSNIKVLFASHIEPTLLAPIAPKDAEDAAQKAKKAAKEKAAKEAKAKAKETAANTCYIFGGTNNEKTGACEYKSQADKDAAAKYVPYYGSGDMTTNGAGDCIVGGGVILNGKKAIANQDQVCTCTNGSFTNCGPASPTNAPDYIPTYLQDVLKDGSADLANQDLVNAIIGAENLRVQEQALADQEYEELQGLLDIVSPDLNTYDEHDGLDSFFITQNVNEDKIAALKLTPLYLTLENTCRKGKSSTTENTHVDIACGLPAIQAMAIEKGLPELKSRLQTTVDPTEQAKLQQTIKDLENHKTNLSTQVTQSLAFAKLQEATNIVNTNIPANENVAARQAERYAELRKSLVSDPTKYSTVLELADGTKTELGALIGTMVASKEAAIGLQDAINYLKNPDVVNRAAMVQKSTVTEASLYAEKLVSDYDPSLLHEIKMQTDPEYLSDQLKSCQKFCAGVCGINAKGYAECVIATQPIAKTTTRTPLIVQRATECKDPGSAVLQETGYLCINEYQEEVAASQQAASDQERAIALLINQAAYKGTTQGTALKNIIDNNPTTSLTDSSTLTPETIGSIITYNQLASSSIDNQTVHNAIDKFLCAGGPGICLLTDQGSFVRQDVSELALSNPAYKTAYQNLFGTAELQYATAMCKDTNTSGPCKIMHDMGNLGQACRPKNASSFWRLLGINQNICNYEHLECVDNTCQLQDEAKGALILAHEASLNVTSAATEFNQKFALSADSLAILKSTSLNRSGCQASNRPYLSNGVCFFCHEAGSQINSTAPDPSYCDPDKQAKLLPTLPGYACAEAGGFCSNLGNYSDATLEPLPYQCGGKLSCFKHTSANRLPSVGESCSLTGCGMGLECLKGTCVSPLVASFDQDYQNGVLASEMDRTTFSTFPVLNTVLELGKLIASSATRAITPSYYTSANNLADYALALNANLTECTTCQKLLTDPVSSIKTNNIAALSSNALLSAHMRTLDKMEVSFGTVAYRFLGNTSRFTGAWTGSRTSLFGETAETSGIGTLLQGDDNVYNQTFLNYAAKNAELNAENASLLARVPVAIPLFVEGAITTADFINVGGVAKGISTASRKIGTSATAQASKLIARELAETTARQTLGHTLSRTFYKTVINTTNIIPDLADNITRTISPLATTLNRGVETIVFKPLGTRYSQFVKGALQTSSSFVAEGVGSNTQAAKILYQGTGNLLQAIFASPAKKLALAEAADSLLSHPTGLLVAIKDPTLLEAAYTKSVAAGYKGTLAKYESELLAKHAATLITNARKGFGQGARELIVPQDAVFLQAMLVASRQSDPSELAELLLLRGRELNLNPVQLSEFIDTHTELAVILDYAERYGLATATDPTSLARFVPLYQDALIRFTTGGPTTLDSWLTRTMAENAGLDPDVIRRFGATLELTNSPFLTRNGQALTQDLMRERLLSMGLSTDYAGSLAAQYSDAPVPFWTRLTDYQGKGFTDIGYTSGEAKKIAELTKSKLLYVDNNKLVFASPLKPSSDEIKLLAKLNTQMESLAKASGFASGLNPDQATNYLGILDFMANNSSAKTRRLLINPSTGGGKNSVLTPLMALFEMEQGNNFMSAVAKGQLNDEIAKAKMLDPFFDQHKAYVVRSDDSGVYRLFDLDGRELSLSELDKMLRNQNIPAWQFWRSKAPSFQLITDHDSLGFLLTEALKYQKGLPTAQRQIAGLMSTFFKSQPAGWVDELGMVGGHWMSSFGKSYKIGELPADFANGLATGLEAVEIYEKSAGSQILQAVETGDLVPTFNRGTNTLDPLTEIRQLQLVGESLDYASENLSESARKLLEAARTNVGEFDLLARTTTLEFKILLGDQALAEELTRAMAQARNYRDAVQARLQILTMIPGDDFVQGDKLIRLAADKRVTGQQYSDVMQALALQDIGAAKLGANLGDLTPLTELTVNPTSLTVSMDDVMDAFGAVYITDATTGIPRSKYGLKTLMADVDLRAANGVKTAADLDGVTSSAAETVVETFERDEIALVIDAKVGSSTRQSLNTTTGAIVAKTEKGLGDADTLYVALLNGDGSNQLIKVERGVPIDYSQGTFFDTPEDLYAEAARLRGLSDDSAKNRILALSQNRTRGANFKPKTSNPPPSVISQAIVIGNIDELSVDTVRQSAGRLRGYEQPPYTLILQSNTPLTVEEAAVRIAQNSLELESNLSFSRSLEEITQFTTQDLTAELRGLANGNQQLLDELAQFDHQLQTVGQNIHNTPRYVDPEEALFNEYLLSRNRLDSLLTNAASHGVAASDITRLRGAYGLLDSALTVQDIAEAIAGTRLAADTTSNLNEKVVALFNKSATQPLPERYAYGAPAATHMQQQAVETVASKTPSHPLLPASASPDLQDALSTSLSRSPTLQVAGQAIVLSELIHGVDFRTLDFILRDGSRLTFVNSDGELFAIVNDQPPNPIADRDITSLLPTHPQQISQITLNNQPLQAATYQTPRSRAETALALPSMTSLARPQALASLGLPTEVSQVVAEHLATPIDTVELDTANTTNALPQQTTPQVTISDSARSDIARLLTPQQPADPAPPAEPTVAVEPATPIAPVTPVTPTPSLFSRAATAVRNWWESLPFNKTTQTITTEGLRSFSVGNRKVVVEDKLPEEVRSKTPKDYLAWADADNPESKFLVLYNESGQSLGFVSLQPINNQGEWDLTFRYVYPEFQNQGLGTTLRDAVYTWALADPNITAIHSGIENIVLIETNGTVKADTQLQSTGTWTSYLSMINAKLPNNQYPIVQVKYVNAYQRSGDRKIEVGMGFVTTIRDQQGNIMSSNTPTLSHDPNELLDQSLARHAPDNIGKTQLVSTINRGSIVFENKKQYRQIDWLLKQNAPTDTAADTVAPGTVVAPATPPTPSLFSRFKQWLRGASTGGFRIALNAPTNPATQRSNLQLTGPDRWTDLTSDANYWKAVNGTGGSGSQFSLRAILASFGRDSSYNTLNNLVQQHNRGEIDEATFLTRLMEIPPEIVSSTNKDFYLIMLSLEASPTTSPAIDLTGTDNLATDVLQALVDDNVTQATIDQISEVINEHYDPRVREEIVKVLAKDGIDLGGMLSSPESQLNYVRTIMSRIQRELIDNEANPALQLLYSRLNLSASLKGNRDYRLDNLKLYGELRAQLERGYGLTLPQTTTLDDFRRFLAAQAFADQVARLPEKRQSDAVSLISSFLVAVPDHIADIGKGANNPQLGRVSDLQFLNQLDASVANAPQRLNPQEKLVGKPEIRWTGSNGYLSLRDIELEGQSLQAHLAAGRTLIIDYPDGHRSYHRQLEDGNYQTLHAGEQAPNITNLKQLEERHLPTAQELAQNQDYTITVMANDTNYTVPTSLFDLIADAPLRMDTRTPLQKWWDNFLGRTLGFTPGHVTLFNNSVSKLKNSIINIMPEYVKLKILFPNQKINDSFSLVDAIITSLRAGNPEFTPQQLEELLINNYSALTNAEILANRLVVNSLEMDELRMRLMSDTNLIEYLAEINIVLRYYLEEDYINHILEGATGYDNDFGFANTTTRSLFARMLLKLGSANIRKAINNPTWQSVVLPQIARIDQLVDMRDGAPERTIAESQRILNSISPSLRAEIDEVISIMTTTGNTDDPLVHSYLYQGFDQAFPRLGLFNNYVNGVGLAYITDQDIADLYYAFTTEAIYNDLFKNIMPQEYFQQHYRDMTNFWGGTASDILSRLPAQELENYDPSLINDIRNYFEPSDNQPSYGFLAPDTIYHIYDENRRPPKADDNHYVDLLYLFTDDNPILVLNHEANHNFSGSTSTYDEIGVELLAQMQRLGHLPEENYGISPYQPGVNELIRVIQEINVAQGEKTGEALFVYGWILQHHFGTDPTQYLQSYYAGETPFATRFANYENGNYYGQGYSQSGSATPSQQPYTPSLSESGQFVQAIYDPRELFGFVRSLGEDLAKQFNKWVTSFASVRNRVIQSRSSVSIEKTTNMQLSQILRDLKQDHNINNIPPDLLPILRQFIQNDILNTSAQLPGRPSLVAASISDLTNIIVELERARPTIREALVHDLLPLIAERGETRPVELLQALNNSPTDMQDLIVNEYLSSWITTYPRTLKLAKIITKLNNNPDIAREIAPYINNWLTIERTQYTNMVDRVIAELVDKPDTVPALLPHISAMLPTDDLALSVISFTHGNPELSQDMKDILQHLLSGEQSYTIFYLNILAKHKAIAKDIAPYIKSWKFPAIVASALSRNPADISRIAPNLTTILQSIDTQDSADIIITILAQAPDNIREKYITLIPTWLDRFRETAPHGSQQKFLNEILDLHTLDENQITVVLPYITNWVDQGIGEQLTSGRTIRLAEELLSLSANDRTQVSKTFVQLTRTIRDPIVVMNYASTLHQENPATADTITNTLLTMYSTRIFDNHQNIIDLIYLLNLQPQNITTLQNSIIGWYRAGSKTIEINNLLRHILAQSQNPSDYPLEIAKYIDQYTGNASRTHLLYQDIPGIYPFVTDEVLAHMPPYTSRYWSLYLNHPNLRYLLTHTTLEDINNLTNDELTTFINYSTVITDHPSLSTSHLIKTANGGVGYPTADTKLFLLNQLLTSSDLHIEMDRITSELEHIQSWIANDIPIPSIHNLLTDMVPHMQANDTTIEESVAAYIKRNFSINTAPTIWNRASFAISPKVITLLADDPGNPVKSFWQAVANNTDIQAHLATISSHKDNSFYYSYFLLFPSPEQWLQTILYQGLYEQDVRAAITKLNNDPSHARSIVNEMVASTKKVRDGYQVFIPSFLKGQINPISLEDFSYLDFYLAKIDNDYTRNFLNLAEHFGIADIYNKSHAQVLLEISNQLKTITLKPQRAEFTMNLQNISFNFPEGDSKTLISLINKLPTTTNADWGEAHSSIETKLSLVTDELVNQLMTTPPNELNQLIDRLVADLSVPDDQVDNFKTKLKGILTRSLPSIPESLLPKLQTQYPTIDENLIIEIESISNQKERDQRLDTIATALSPLAQDAPRKELLAFKQNLIKQINQVIKQRKEAKPQEQKIQSIVNNQKSSIKQLLKTSVGLTPLELSSLFDQLLQLGDMKKLMGKFTQNSLNEEEKSLFIVKLEELYSNNLDELLRSNPQIKGIENALDSTDLIKYMKKIVIAKIEIKDKIQASNSTITLVLDDRSLLDVWQGKVSGTCFGDHPEHLAKRENIIPVPMLKDGELFGNALFIIQSGRMILAGLDPSESFTAKISDDKMREFVDHNMAKFHEMATANNWELMIAVPEEVGGLSNRGKVIGGRILDEYADTTQLIPINPEEKLQPEYGYEPKNAYRLSDKGRKAIAALSPSTPTLQQSIQNAIEDVQGTVLAAQVTADVAREILEVPTATDIVNPDCWGSLLVSPAYAAGPTTGSGCSIRGFSLGNAWQAANSPKFKSTMQRVWEIASGPDGDGDIAFRKRYIGAALASYAAVEALASTTPCIEDSPTFILYHQMTKAISKVGLGLLSDGLNQGAQIYGVANDESIANFTPNFNKISYSQIIKNAIDDYQKYFPDTPVTYTRDPQALTYTQLKSALPKIKESLPSIYQLATNQDASDILPELDPSWNNKEKIFYILLDLLYDVNRPIAKKIENSAFKDSASPEKVKEYADVENYIEKQVAITHSPVSHSKVITYYLIQNNGDLANALEDSAEFAEFAARPLVNYDNAPIIENPEVWIQENILDEYSRSVTFNNLPLKEKLTTDNNTYYDFSLSNRVGEIYHTAEIVRLLQYVPPELISAMVADQYHVFGPEQGFIKAAADIDVLQELDDINALLNSYNPDAGLLDPACIEQPSQTEFDQNE